MARAFNAMARAVGRSRQQTRALVAGVSHDLRTPLTSIRGFAQALRDRAVEEPDEVVEASGIILGEAERVQALVEDLLYLAEIETGQVPLASGTVDLSALAARCARRFAPRFDERTIALTVDAAQAAMVQGDAAKLERILDNLLENARKYTPQGGRVHLRLACGEEVRVAVFNSGSHIPVDELSRIFDRYYRLDRARSCAERGSGLGLAIARELAELHGGTVEAESDDAGTTFTLRLPAASAESRVLSPELGNATVRGLQPVD